MKAHKRLMASLRGIEQQQIAMAARRQRIMAAIEAAGQNWGRRLAAETWHTDYASAVSTALHKFWIGTGAGPLQADNTAPSEFPVVAGQHPVRDGNILAWCCSGARAFNRANRKAAAFDRGARRGFATGLESQVKKLAVSLEAYRQLAGLQHWHGLAKRTAHRIAAAGLAKFAAFEPLKTEFVQWEVGGTYRHRCLIRFDRPVECGNKDGGHYRPGLVGDLFGRGSSSKSGVRQVAPDALEIFQDQ